MRWTKGKPAAQAPTDRVLLVRFAGYDGRPGMFATMKARMGHDRFGALCRQWEYSPGGRSSDYAPEVYWELPA